MPRTSFLTVGIVLVGTVSPCLSFQPLFDGKSLGPFFVQHDGDAKYEAIDGVIVGTCVPNTPNRFLCTKKHFSDFVLEYEFKVDPKLNAGVQIRSNAYGCETTVIAKTPSGDKRTIKITPKRVHGYQIEVDPSDRAWTAGVYDEARRGWLDDLADNEPGRKAFRANQWNKIQVEAIGNSIKTWLNGMPAARANIHITPDGRFAYVSNRDRTKREEGDPKKDTLACVSLDSKTGDMKLVGYFPTPSSPRSFCVDVKGQFVYSGGTQTSTLFAYRINQKTGAPEHFATYEAGGIPMWVTCATVGK